MPKFVGRVALEVMPDEEFFNEGPAMTHYNRNIPGPHDREENHNADQQVTPSHRSQLATHQKVHAKYPKDQNDTNEPFRKHPQSHEQPGKTPIDRPGSPGRRGEQ